MKALVVDDTKKDLETYVDLTREFADEILTASCVEEGVRIALSERPDLIVTDKDMPDGTGNDLARRIKEQYEPKIVGVTGGNHKEFDRQYVDVSFSKTENADYFKRRVADFLRGKREYFFEDVRDAVYKLRELYAPLSILAQGYEAGAKLRRGEKVIANVDLEAPSDEQMIDILNLQNIGVDASKLFVGCDSIMDTMIMNVRDEALLEVLEGFREDELVRSFFRKLTETDLLAICESEVLRFNELYFQFCELHY